MKDKYFRLFISSVILLAGCMGFISCAMMSEEANLYRESRPLVAKQDYDAAFMKLVESLMLNPDSPYAGSTKFGIAEYYLLQNDPSDAVSTLQEYIKKYPNDSGVIIAELILYKLSEQTVTKETATQMQRDFIETIRKKVFEKPHFFAFSQNKKRFSYRSSLGRTYKIIDYVDKVVVLRDDETFLELAP